MEELKRLWNDVQNQSIPLTNNTPQALFEGINLRLSLGKAMQAAVETVKACAAIGKVINSPLELWAWVECSVEVGAAIMSMFEALVQRISEIQYVTAVVLSEHIPSGISPKDLENNVTAYLNDPTLDKYSWYFGMNNNRLANAKQALINPGWFTLALDKLRELGFVFDNPVSGKLEFRPVDFEVGMHF